MLTSECTSRAQNINQEPEPVQGGLIDTAQYLGNLKFTVWSKIRQTISYSELIYDISMHNIKLFFSEADEQLTNKREKS